MDKDDLLWQFLLACVFLGLPVFWWNFGFVGGLLAYILMLAVIGVCVLYTNYVVNPRYHARLLVEKDIEKKEKQRYIIEVIAQLRDVNYSLANIPPELLEDHDFKYSLLHECPSAIKYIRDRGENMARYVLSRDGSLLEYFRSYQNKHDIVRIAIENSPGAWKHVAGSLKIDPDIYDWHYRFWGDPSIASDLHNARVAQQHKPIPKQAIQVKTEPKRIEDHANEVDPLYDEAVGIVLKTRRASISSVQRQLRIGYNRAARLIEDMERAGLVSAMQSNGNREVLAPHQEP